MNKIVVTEKDGKKYINDKELLYSYDCMTNWIVFRYFIFFIALFVSFKHIDIIEGKIAFFFTLFIAIGWALIDIKTLFHRGIYLTQNYIITFSGREIPLSDIYYKWGAGGAEGYGSTSLRLYAKKNLILSCLVKNDDEYNNMISTLQTISGNQDLSIISKANGKRKLVLEEDS